MPDSDKTTEERLGRILGMLEPIPRQISTLYDRLGKTREELIEQLAEIRGELKTLKGDVKELNDVRAAARIANIERAVDSIDQSVGKIKKERDNEQRDSTIKLAVHDLEKDAKSQSKWRDRWMTLLFSVISALVTVLAVSWVMGKFGETPQVPEDKTHESPSTGK